MSSFNDVPLEVVLPRLPGWTPLGQVRFQVEDVVAVFVHDKEDDSNAGVIKKGTLTSVVLKGQ